MSEQRANGSSTPEDEVGEAGATSQAFGNLSVEDDAEGTVDPGDLTRGDVPDDDAVEAEGGR